MKRGFLAILLVFCGSAVGFDDGFEAHALEPADIKSISIDAALPVPVKDVKVSANGLLTATTDKPTPPVPVCGPTPAGFTVVMRSWNELFGNAYPKSPSWLQPIGSWVERTSSQKGGKPAAGKLYVAPFIADEGLHKIGWVGAQAVYAAGYMNPQSASEVYVAISPCPNATQAACSNRARSSSLFYGIRANVDACVVTPGQLYYAIVGYFPRNLDPKANTCAKLNPSGGVLCDANFESR